MSEPGEWWIITQPTQSKGARYKYSTTYVESDRRIVQSPASGYDLVIDQPNLFMWVKGNDWAVYIHESLLE